MIAYIFCLPPHRLPSFIKTGGGRFYDFKTIQQVFFVIQFESQLAGVDDRDILVYHGIRRNPVVS